MSEPRPVLITGGGGMLALALREALGDDVAVHAPTRAELDVVDANAVHRAVGRLVRPRIYHCAAWTDVDGAESDPEAAAAVNVEGTRNVIRAADEVGGRVIHLSTDYVFPGDAEGEIPVHARRSPLGVYGRTKAEAEEIVEASPGPHLIVRTSWLFGPGGRHFVATMRRLSDREVVRVVADQHGRPTYTPDLARALVAAQATGATGVLHLANAGSTTWADFAEAIFRRIGSDTRVERVTTAEWGAPAPRPLHSVLDLSRADRLIGPLPGWSDALERFLRLDPTP